MQKKIQSDKVRARLRRKASIRKNLAGTAERPRLCVFRSNKHIYTQVIDDSTGHVLVSVSSLSKALQEQLTGLSKTDVAKKIGQLTSERCKEHSIEKVVFDRNGYLYAGRVSALADAAREAGLVF